MTLPALITQEEADRILASFQTGSLEIVDRMGVRLHALVPALMGKDAATIATLDVLIGSNAADLISRKYTLASGENVVRGEVAGIITSGGRAASSGTANGNGAETPFGIFAEDADATDGDVDALIYTRGSFNENAVVLGSAHTAHTIAAIREGLRDRGIFLETPVKRYP